MARGAITTPKKPGGSMHYDCLKRGMVKNAAQKLIAQGTDWRIFERAEARIESVIAAGTANDRFKGS